MEKKEAKTQEENKKSEQQKKKTEQKQPVKDYYEAESWQFSGCGD
jgi:hypothetical protein